MKIISLFFIASLLTHPTFCMLSQEFSKKDAAKIEYFAQTLKYAWKEMLYIHKILPSSEFNDKELIEVLYAQYLKDINDSVNDIITVSSESQFARSILQRLIPNYEDEVLFSNISKK